MTNTEAAATLRAMLADHEYDKRTFSMRERVAMQRAARELEALIAAAPLGAPSAESLRDAAAEAWVISFLGEGAVRTEDMIADSLREVRVRATAMGWGADYGPALRRLVARGEVLIDAHGAEEWASLACGYVEDDHGDLRAAEVTA